MTARQGLEVSIAELANIIAKLLDEQSKDPIQRDRDFPDRYNQRWVLPITNETGESDKWRFET